MFLFAHSLLTMLTVPRRIRVKSKPRLYNALKMKKSENSFLLSACIFLRCAVLEVVKPATT